MGRTPNSGKDGGLRKGPWTIEEDQKLIDYIHKNGYGKWRTLPKNAGIQPMVDLELLRLAAALLATQGNQNVEFNYLENTLQIQENNHHVQEQTLIQEVPNCSPLSTLSCGVPFSNETSSKLMEHNVDQNISDLRPIICQTSITKSVTLDDCHRVDRQSNFSNNVNLMSSFLPSSTACTPSSSRTPINSNSNSAYINEEDREISYCSNMFNYELQEVLNANEINAKILSLNYGDFKAEIKAIDVQESLEGGVSSSNWIADKFQQQFTQTFFLAPQDKGYFAGFLDKFNITKINFDY
ncbi:hypothetical protein L1987_58583 [Smallanthus sonchifolius]|uniref:Uncharacterized protein n=1 Tax=Smallanthus sonchifolius TaxID=185202 RepID=A0ACB9DFQ8_9ASTR|nr:hypothetical protein L1987_58583 [Smallanthus sonchifolius]